ncbi:hypothetical protein J8273_7792 [Carpediemonas membranifera]|uniref:Transmembrane protein n=1 Tax=Carpediemonas membranifera TaxID=201153 RepID=A0A8J6E1C1_9EUKA|nr:hypothetical protein J8273_7792 [Carpediemonas membranifera]|eukprot:KAG9390442.1 hypothetical protein J8273_7792 [Carpediemonas membranifera]
MVPVCVILASIIIVCSASTLPSYYGSRTLPDVDGLGIFMNTDGKTLISSTKEVYSRQAFVIYDDPMDLSKVTIINAPVDVSPNFWGSNPAVSGDTIVVFSQNATKNFVHFIERVDGVWRISEGTIPSDLQAYPETALSGPSFAGDKLVVLAFPSTLLVYAKSASGWVPTQRLDLINHTKAYTTTVGTTVFIPMYVEATNVYFLQQVDYDSNTGQFALGPTFGEEEHPAGFAMWGVSAISPSAAHVAVATPFNFSGMPRVDIYSDDGASGRSMTSIHAPDGMLPQDFSFFGLGMAFIDDETLVIGAYLCDPGSNGEQVGCAIEFGLKDGVWVNQTMIELPAANRTGGGQPQFGRQVVYCRDAGALVISAPNYEVNDSAAGVLFLYHDPSNDSAGANTIAVIAAVAAGCLSVTAVVAIVMLLTMVGVITCATVGVGATYGIALNIINKKKNAVVGSVAPLSPAGETTTLEVEDGASTEEDNEFSEEESTHTRHPSQTTLGSKPVLPPARLPPMGAAKLPPLLAPTRAMPVLPRRPVEEV